MSNRREMISYIITASVVIIALLLFIAWHYSYAGVYPLRFCSECH